ncbi:MAG: pyruvate dehydrogenase complex dihydrolipoamide acetyltransferase [Rhodospirillales bacterium]|nr:pyruvate dehydrogenase complex dihydrolipoamide acetyltransferase [Rhodospirillales bacterium]
MPIKVTMPALSPTMTEGTLAKWVKNEGDMVSPGDVIAEIETDKATMEVEAVDEGKLARILIPAGTENVPVNELIAVMLEEDEDAGAIDSFLKQGANDLPQPAGNTGATAAADTATPSAPVSSAPAAAPTPAPAQKGGRVVASPLAKRIANQNSVNLAQVQGTGPNGRIVKADVEKALKSGSGAMVAGSSAPVAMATGPDARALADAYGMEYELVKNSGVRKVIAKRLLEAKQTIPHFYLTVECQLDNLLEARKQINAAADGAYKLSVNDFVIKAVAEALYKYPAANVAWTDDAILQFKHSDVSVAVATENGLITPIIKKAETKSLRDISDEMKELAKRARDGKLKPEEFQGGTFSISNLGMFGVSEFSAIINPPQSCILAVGAGSEKPYVKDGQILIGNFMNVTLSTDHRSVDGAVGAEFLQVFKRFIENPILMMV